jgi:hypothetical protein
MNKSLKPLMPFLLHSMIRTMVFSCEIGVWIWPELAARALFFGDPLFLGLSLV